MKLLFLITLLFALSACATKAKVDVAQKEYATSFNDVWSQVSSDPYETLPQTKVSYFKLSSSDGGIARDAMRTLNDDADLLEPFEKLAHLNGICFRGGWKIDQQNPYGGYFKQGSEALVIARASTAMSNVKSGSTRAFGFAGKLFPTMQPRKINKQASANFFLVEDLGGTDAKRYRDVALTNEPSISVTMEAVKNVAYAIKIASAFSSADKHPSIRQLYQISYLGENADAKVLTPKWMKIETADSQRVDKEDFREELKIKNAEALTFNVSVASEIVGNAKVWRKIGVIKLDESATSSTCDRRLHFSHPKWREDLDYGE